MGKIFWLSLALLLLVSACGRDETVAETPPETLHFASADEIAAKRVVPHSYLVAFKESDLGISTKPSPRNLFAQKMALVNRMEESAGVKSHSLISRLNLTHPGESFDLDMSISPMPFFEKRLPAAADFTQLTEVSFHSEEEARRLLTKWAEDDAIWFAEPNYRQDLKGNLEDTLVEDFQDNPRTPWLEEVSFIEAIQKMAEVPEIASPLVAVMDSGVDVEHPNLTEVIYRNEQGENKLCRGDFFGCNTTVAEKEVLGDGNVYPTGTTGFSQFCDPSLGQCQHGTHVAGLIAARGSAEFTGMCPYCRILVVKVVEIERNGAEESFPIKDSSILAGLAYISGFKSEGQPLVRVINASFGKFERSRSVELFIKALKNYGRGTLMVAAAGNEDTMKRQYPAGFEDVLSVANVKSNVNNPTKSKSSNFGMWVDIAAPGDGFCQSETSSGILSTIPGGIAGCQVGTSMASPVVAGIAGLVLAKEPNLSAADLERRLVGTALPDKLYLDGVNNAYRPNIKGAGIVPLLGSGIVNALTAIDPSLNTAPAVTAQRPDLVRSGCGTVGGREGAISVWFLLSPLLLLFQRRRGG